jgi:hypothetical protein
MTRQENLNRKAVNLDGFTSFAVQVPIEMARGELESRRLKACRWRKEGPSPNFGDTLTTTSFWSVVQASLALEYNPKQRFGES